MRLLKVSTIELEEFAPNNIPEYAILSHAWETEEILLTDIQHGTAQQKTAWRKVQSACQQTQKDRLEYVWIDTCCIDKTSSAELSEALNSMYYWYQQAKVCYAYLNDVPANEDIKQKESKFASSRWFTRGWTLQELLAPRKILFFSHDWIKLGEKEQLTEILAAITKIPEGILSHFKPLRAASVAQRMSWASQRNTTRPEDMAYSLMGVFGVHMPMLYGEGGEKAFLRLQEEIMKSSDDTSIFAWVDSTPPPDDGDTLCGLLAKSVECFTDSHNIVPYRQQQRPPYSMTNKGLRIDFPLLVTPLGSTRKDGFIAPLDCVQFADDGGFKFLGISVIQTHPEGQQYGRSKAHAFTEPWGKGEMTTIYVPQTFLPDELSHASELVQDSHKFQLRHVTSNCKMCRVTEVIPGRSLLERRIYPVKPEYTLIFAVIRRCARDQSMFTILVWYDRILRIRFDVVGASDRRDLRSLAEELQYKPKQQVNTVDDKRISVRQCMMERGGARYFLDFHVKVSTVKKNSRPKRSSTMELVRSKTASSGTLDDA